LRLSDWVGGRDSRRLPRPEHDDVAAVARREGLPYDQVACIVSAEAEELLG
jgi:hypothetical protein